MPRTSPPHSMIIDPREWQETRKECVFGDVHKTKRVEHISTPIATKIDSLK